MRQRSDSRQPAWLHQGITLYLMNLVFSYEGAMTLVDKQRSTDITYLKFFEVIPHNILTSKLDKYRFRRWTTWWILAGWLELESCSQRLCSDKSHWWTVSSRCLVLEPVLFNIITVTQTMGLSTLSASLQITQPSGAVDATERRDVIQRDLKRIMDCIKKGWIGPQASWSRAWHPCQWLALEVDDLWSPF